MARLFHLRAVLPSFHLLGLLWFIGPVYPHNEENKNGTCIHFPTHVNDTEQININFTIIFTEYLEFHLINGTSDFQGDTWIDHKHPFQINLTNYVYNHEQNPAMLALGLAAMAEACQAGLFGNVSTVWLQPNGLCFQNHTEIPTLFASVNQTQFVAWFEAAEQQSRIWHIELVRPMFINWLVFWVCYYLRRRR